MSPRSLKIARSDDIAVSLNHYPSGTVQPKHNHSNTQVSFLIMGGFAERSEGRDFTPLARQFGIMPAGHGHQVQFGEDGALMLSIDCYLDTENGGQRRNWTQFDGSTARMLQIVRGGGSESLPLARDILAHLEDQHEEHAQSMRNAPNWLKAGIEQLVEEPETSVSDLAKLAGVHRVHFSRVFQRHCGLSPTEFRLLRRSAIAMRRSLDRDVSLAQAAVEAGFADQAHWTRTCRILTGLTPSSFREKFSA